jgi:hypothetical protein
MAQQSLASEGIGVGTSVNYGSNDIGADIAGGTPDAGDASKEEEPVGGFGFPSIKLPKFNRNRNNERELNPAEAYANDYATNTNNAGQQNLNESQKAIRGWVSPIPGSIGTQEGALARVRGAGDPGRQAQAANKQAYGAGTRNYSSLPPTLSSQFANWGARSDAQAKHNATNGYMENLGGNAKNGTEIGAPIKAVGEALWNVPNNIDTVYQRFIGSPQGVKSGSNTAVTGGAGAAGAAAAGSTAAVTALGLDMANQLLQIYYDD